MSPGETAVIPIGKRAHFRPEYVTTGWGDYSGGRHDYDGDRMGFEVEARYSDGSVDGRSENIELMEASYGSGISRCSTKYYVDGVNRKVADHVRIDQNKWYYFQYHNYSFNDIDIAITSYSWWS